MHKTGNLLASGAILGGRDIKQNRYRTLETMGGTYGCVRACKGPSTRVGYLYPNETPTHISRRTEECSHLGGAMPRNRSQELAEVPLTVASSVTARRSLSRPRRLRALSE